jgi:hypothetical protein
MDGIRRLISIPFLNLLIDRDKIILGLSNFIKRGQLLKRGEVTE